MSAADAEPLVEVSTVAPALPGPPAQRARDWGAFRAEDGATGARVLLRPAAEWLRIEREGVVETVPWSAVVGVALTQVPVGGVAVRAARIQFRRGRPLDLADVHAPGADGLPASLEDGAGPLLRVERLRMVVAAVAAGAGLSPRTRDHFHRGGRGVPVPDLESHPHRTPQWLRPLLVPVSILVLAALVPAMTIGGSVAVHASILVHETGHALAMTAAGVEVRSLLFLPAVGAALRTEHPYRTRMSDAMVALAGPLTGAPIAAVALLLCDGPPDEALQWGLVAGVAYNLLNLLPFAPLDGGRVLLALASALRRPLRTALVWTPVAAAFGFVLLDGLTDLTIFELLLVAAAVVLTRLAVRRLDFHEWVIDARIAPDALRAALRDVTHGFGGAVREDADGGAPPTPLTPAQAGVTVLAYVAVAAALAACTAAVMPLVPVCRAALSGGSE